MADKKFPSLWIETGDDEKICVVMSGTYGPETNLPFVTPTEDLVAAAEIDYTAYRREIQRLYEGHPLFEAKLNISSRFHVRQFLEGIRSGKSTELMHITDGYHYHTIRAESKEILDQIENALIRELYIVPEK